jgi:ribosomal protein S18 acetylase RimI-like enzyme
VVVEIRSAGPQHIPALLKLWRSAGIPPGVSDDEQGLELLMEGDPQALLVAEFRGVVVGSLIAAFDGWRGNFYRLAVHPDHRRKGVARALLAEGERRLRARGALRLSAVVDASDAGALELWRSAGYERQTQQVRLVKHACSPEPGDGSVIRL